MKTLPTDLLTVREAATRVGRTPETLRRWVWSGRLQARKQGNRLVIASEDLRRAAAANHRQTLAGWLETVESRLTADAVGPKRSAADLVLDDRRQRSVDEGGHASR